ncbi:MAG: peptidylprolyl isomerase [SAR86 cluster bacterium]|uniref:Peptidyl-prolyl cis-trans isomerase n=1 Tax=SAR86 cluster bacterium TaxID=2030880 RepID=A0A2A4WY24_9GAMM|nr:MAG: peptidylprolyl isomerase [SAR86 cluster bacterium]
MRQSTIPSLLLLIFSLLTLLNTAIADTSTALLAMEDPQNPLVRISTSQGEIYLELFPAEAPGNVDNFLALAEGEKEFTNPDTGALIQARYYNGMRFHRVVPGFIIQAGSPAYNPLGLQVNLLDDEINADALGLDQISVLNPDGSFADVLNIESKLDFHEEILTPLYSQRNITDVETALSSQHQVFEALQGLSVKSVYENQGYRYDDSLQSRPIERGTVALANSGPDSNGPEFFISLTAAEWLSGKYTVIGRVVEGQEVMDSIGNTAIDPDQFSRLSTLIYSVRKAN